MAPQNRKDEIRNLRASVRAVGEPDEMRIEGYPIRFGENSHLIRDFFDSFIEEVSPDAEIRYKDDDLYLLWNHDFGEVMGRMKSETLQVERDSSGIKISAILPNTQRGRDTHELVRRGDIDGMSFRFSEVGGSDHNRIDYDAEPPHRVLDNIEISEVSFVATPAYPTTDVSVVQERIRSYAAERENQRQSNDDTERMETEKARQLAQIQIEQELLALRGGN